jgi:hypothetical protein
LSRFGSPEAVDTCAVSVALPVRSALRTSETVAVAPPASEPIVQVAIEPPPKQPPADAVADT